MKVRHYTPADYEMIRKWSKDHGDYPYLPEDWMPKVGLIVSSGHVDVYAVWMFKTDGAIVLLEGLISNRLASREDRKGALEYLFDEVRKIAKEGGYKVICTIAGTPALDSKVQALGFMSTPNVSYLSIGV